MPKQTYPNSAPSIPELRKAGFHVVFDHYFRNDYSASTVCVLVRTTPKGETMIFTGRAECSKDDTYNRRLGNAIALGRAYKRFTEAKEAKQAKLTEQAIAAAQAQAAKPKIPSIPSGSPVPLRQTILRPADTPYSSPPITPTPKPVTQPVNPS